MHKKVKRKPNTRLKQNTPFFIASLSCWEKKKILKALRKECLTVFHYCINPNFGSFVHVCSTQSH